MTPFATTATFIMSVGTLILGVITLGIIYLLIFRKSLGDFGVKTEKFILKYSLHASFLVSLGAIAGSLVYSDIIGFAACQLCFIQRLFLYPQAFMFAVALWRHAPLGATLKADIGMEKFKVDRAHHDGISDYSLVLSIPGLLVAMYQYYGQMFSNGILPCPASLSASCSQKPFVEFGFITIPMMSLVAFAFLITLMILRIKAIRRHI